MPSEPRSRSRTCCPTEAGGFRFICAGKHAPPFACSTTMDHTVVGSRSGELSSSPCRLTNTSPGHLSPLGSGQDGISANVNTQRVRALPQGACDAREAVMRPIETADIQRVHILTELVRERREADEELLSQFTAGPDRARISVEASNLKSFSVEFAVQKSLSDPVRAVVLDADHAGAAWIRKLGPEPGFDSGRLESAESPCRPPGSSSIPRTILRGRAQSRAPWTGPNRAQTVRAFVVVELSDQQFLEFPGSRACISRQLFWNDGA